MSAVSQLINVSYTDLTNHTDAVGGDVLGIPFEFHWGPINKLQVLNRTQFFNAYPERLPVGRKISDIYQYYGYAQIKKAFELGLPFVEAYRVMGNWGYFMLAAYVDDGAIHAEWPPLVDNKLDHEPDETDIASGLFAIYTKYPGVPPKPQYYDFQEFGVEFEYNATTKYLTIRVAGYETQGADTIQVAVLEEFSGSINPDSKSDGVSDYIVDLVSASEYIGVVLNQTALANNTYSTSDTIVALTFLTWDASLYEDEENHPSMYLGMLDADSSDWSDALDQYEDTLVSNATLLLSPVATSNTESASTYISPLDTKLVSIAKSRQDLLAVRKFPIDLVFTSEKIKGFLNGESGITGTNALRDKFSVLVTGREIYNVLGYQIQLDCAGGWCGATANVASEYRTNQLASAFTYGSYIGTLTNSLSFDEVCELHELGVISVFNSNQGPLIWGVRSMNQKQNSYFAKANVMRVLAEILRQIFPICLSAIHTDAATNPITKSNYNIQFNNVIIDEISKQNLASDSYANCLGDINSDANTKGGKIFNVMLSLHFYGLVESINIAVYATDSSVTTSIQ